jgi:hypothetical protein
MGALVRKIAISLVMILAVVAAYLSFWPVPAEPVSWQASVPPGFTGPYAPNTKLTGLRNIDIGSESGPEHIAIGPDGKLYAAMNGGTLVRMDPTGGKREVFANTGGITRAIVGVAMLLSACATPFDNTTAHPTAGLEEIYILRSIREQREPVPGWCSSARAGFEPFPADAERFFSFWSLRLRPEDGRAVETKEMRVAELRACFGATSERARQNFHAEISLGSISLHGNGECLALRTDFPEAGLIPVRCQLVLTPTP